MLLNQDKRLVDTAAKRGLDPAFGPDIEPQIQ